MNQTVLNQPDFKFEVYLIWEQKQYIYFLHQAKQTLAYDDRHSLCPFLLPLVFFILFLA